MVQNWCCNVNRGPSNGPKRKQPNKIKFNHFCAGRLYDTKTQARPIFNLLMCTKIGHKMHTEKVINDFRF